MIQWVFMQWMRIRLTIMNWKHVSKIIYCQYINNKITVKIFVENDENENEKKNKTFDI